MAIVGDKMDEVKVKDEQALENKCPSCTASIKFNPTLGKFKCEYCGSVFTLEELKKYKNNASTDEKNKPIEEQVGVDDYDGYISYKCESCGAEIVADEQTASTFCIYCGNTAILKSKLSGKFTPSRIIPFKNDKDLAVETFKKLRKGKPLMPREFTSVKNIERIRGIYIPFWLYDVNVSGDIKMKGKIVTTWIAGEMHYTKTDTYDVIRGGNMDYHSIPVDGSSRFDNDTMNTLEPFHFEELVPYNHAYLSGFYAEKYDEEGQTSFDEAGKRALNSTRIALESDPKRYTSKTIVSNQLVATQKKREYVLLPVWMVNVKFNNKMHLFAMNGQTGEFVGDIPLDGKRFVFYMILTFVISMAVISIIHYVCFKLGV
ncbi:MAG: hypothetical protein J6X28_00320 [Bacilli bacterium]|nr:hypothetical protein [Bacilli bacterium]